MEQICVNIQQIFFNKFLCHFTMTSEMKYGQKCQNPALLERLSVWILRIKTTGRWNVPASRVFRSEYPLRRT